MERQLGLLGGLEQQAAPEGHQLTGQLDGRHVSCGVARCEIARFVELAIVGQIRLGYDAENPSTLHDGGAVEQHVTNLQRQADDGEQRQALGSLEHRAQRVLHPVEQRSLVEEVVTRVGGQP